MNQCLVIFAKEPEKGRVKTRLRGFLSERECLRLYQAFLKDTLELFKAFPYHHKVLAYDCRSGNPRYLKKIVQIFAPAVTFYKQKGKDLGQRMHLAFVFSQEINSDQTVMIGSDSPNLPVKYIQEAYKKLNHADVVLGPCQDGGFYLIGLNKPSAGIFRNVPWSSPSVLGAVIKNSGRLNKKVELLKEWYDIDTPQALNRLTRDLKKNKQTAPWTSKLLKI